jgi:hypothetical protein
MGSQLRTSDYDSVSSFSELPTVVITTFSYGISNIRTLVGHKVNVDWVERSAAVRF